MTYLIAAVVVLGVLIFFHELGHFIAAKIFGVRVERFSIGFPPRLFGKKIGETDYCVSAIPLGGYVKLSGMIDESLDTDTLTGAPHEFMSKPLYQKVIIITAGVLMNFLLAVAIFGGIAWIQGESVLPTTTLASVQEASIADNMGFQSYDKILQVNGEPIQNWKDINHSFLENFGKDTRYLVERSGEKMTIHVEWGNLKLKDTQQLGISPLIPAEVGELVPGYPAYDAGLEEGDRIIAINDTAISSWEEMSLMINSKPGVPIELTVLRNGEMLNINITPKADDARDAEGNEIVVGRIGIGVPVAYINYSFLPAMLKGFKDSIFWAKMNITGFIRVITGKDSARDTLAGPIAIIKFAGDTASQSFLGLIPMIAVLSVVLAMINILPIPALDGGHLVIILIEGIRKKPLSVKTKTVIQQIGMVFLLVLMLFIFYNDIARQFFSN
jgi:regulator of sigma E protease